MNCRRAPITKKLSGDNKVLLYSIFVSAEMCNVETSSKNESFCYFCGTVEYWLSFVYYVT